VGVDLDLRMLIMGQPGVEVGDAGVQNGVARDEGGLGGAGLVPVVVFVIFILGSFEIPLGECAAPEKGVLKHELAESR
jgi:hypothetical protein